LGREINTAHLKKERKEKGKRWINRGKIKKWKTKKKYNYFSEIHIL
jgi:hypothetical protein